MPATITLEDILVEIAERYSCGTVLREIDPDNVSGSSFTLLNSYNAGPTTAAEIPIRSGVTFVDPADSGTATASTTTTVTDSSKSWTVDEWIGFVVRMGGWRAVITDSDATSVTFAALDEAPTVGKYSIEYGSSWVSNYVPSTGVVSLNPSLGTLNAAQTNPFTAIVWNPVVKHGDRVLDAVNRAHQNRLGRWELRPLTYVPDGDLQGSKVTDYWTAAANGTASYVTAQVFPAGSAADAFGQVGVSRLLQLVSSGGSTSMDSNGIRVTPNTSTTGYQWYFLTSLRLVSGTGTATFSVRDNTASAAITTNFIRGFSDNTFATTDIGDFTFLEGTFNLPENCGEIAFRLALSATGLTAQMGPIIAFPLQAYAFPLPNRIETAGQIGNFFWGGMHSGPAGFSHVSLSEPLTVGGYTHKIIDYGDHRSVSFNFTPTRAVWYEEYVSGSSLTAMTDTTTFPLDRICKWAVFELYDRLMRDEMHSKARAESGAPLPSIFRPLRNAAFKSADNSSYEPEIKNIRGRV